KNGSPVLLDFGSARQALSEETKTLTSLVTPGYAPFEQYYSRSDEQGPFSDIYGMGATLYRAVTGIAPIDAIERGKSILTTSKDAIVSASEIAKGKYPDHILMAIDHAIQFKAEERPQTIEEWLKDFEVPVATTIKSKAQKQISEKRDAELSLSKNLEEAYETARTYNVNQSTLKPEVEEVVKQDPPPPQSQKAASQNTPRNSVNTHLTISLVLLVLIGVGIYLFSREYSKEKPVQQSVEMAESIKQKQLIAEQNATSAKLRDATKIKDRQIEKLLESAENDLQENRLTSPSGNNAYDKYNKVLELNFGNKKAVAGIEKILDSYQSSFNESLASQQFDQAAEYIERIRAIHPDSTRLLGARRLLNDATEREKTNNLQAETEQAKRAANATRAREAEKIKRKEELTAQNRLSMNNKVYDNLMEAQELFEAKKYDQGLEVLRALELEKNLTPYEKAQLYNSFGLTYFTLEKPNDAVRSYEKVLEQADLPEAMITRALYSLAQIYYSMDEFTKSLEPLKKSYKMTMDSGDEPRETLLQLMSANYHKLGDYKNMVNVLKKMVSLYPKTDYWLSLAGAYSALAQHENQITVMEMLYEQGELKTGTQQVNFASLYLLRDKPLKAIEVLEKGMSEGTIERTTLNQFLLSKAQKSAQGLEQGSPGK
ncbi:MAG: tetratricopeptide (TPR) repeat protein, partial [Gammaproteobacteria bacterium]